MHITETSLTLHINITVPNPNPYASIYRSLTEYINSTIAYYLNLTMANLIPELNPSLTQYLTLSIPAVSVCSLPRTVTH